MRAPRITASAPANWKLFRDIICQGKVPSAIIVTGLEEAEDRQGWWWKHKGGFDKNDIKLSTIAGAECITACRGKARSGHVYDEEYEESRDQIRRLIRSTILDNPITVKPLEWFQTITENVKEWSWCSLSFQDVEVPFEEASEAAKQMGSLPGFTPDFVEELRQKMKKETE
ncbi:hypothetical protein D9756_009234 [Leucocoprinus leucothites]|uniref:Uncharacterized protein n=1 Tax=Leucocoprinus leucothites TaxID=201217 RepID=A0A8H5CXZ5_9AGAR|nr:hypothetical protein D9756_009234 [Leucoagaricus leucothites]